MMGSKAFESPLISHARMRGMYRALVETRLLGQRAGKGAGWPRGFEACWVATAIDLKDTDLTSVPRAAWLVDYVRRVGKREGGKAATGAEVARALRAMAADKEVCSRIAAMDRMLCAVGMAVATKAADAQGVVTAYVGTDELTAAEWKRLLGVAMDGELPLMIVATPGKTDVSGIVKRMGTVTIPVIPVDAGDVVALYRVAQETLVRARADGGVVVVECVSCGVDPIKLMGTQLVKKKICTQRWVMAVEETFRKALSG